MKTPYLCHLLGQDTALSRQNEVGMTDMEYSRKLEELDQLLNDPTVPMQPDRIWSLLADVSRFPAPHAAEQGAT